MSLGKNLYKMRKNINLSQEEVADKLNVTRQTVSKWETDESKPDFDKVMPICELYGIKPDDLFSEKELESISPDIKEPVDYKPSKKMWMITSAIFLYFVAVIFVIIGEELFDLNDGLIASCFLLICAVATCILVMQGMLFKKDSEKHTEEDKALTDILQIISGLFCIVYLLISFLTMAWHITWIIWVIYGLVANIIRTIYEMRGGKSE